MKIEQKGENIIFTCDLVEAGTIAAVLTYDRDDCANYCPHLRRDVCRINFRTDDKEVCVDLGCQIWEFIEQTNPDRKI